MKTETALKNLSNRALASYYEKWYPGKEVSEDELLHNYIAYLENRIVALEEKATELSWIKNPDRMGQ